MGLPKTSSLPDTIKSTFELDNTNDDMALVSQLVFEHSLYEEEYEDLDERANYLRTLLGEVLSALLGPDFAGDVHCGTLIDHLDRFLDIMRYPTRDDTDANGTFCCWNRDNGCVIAKELLVPLFLSAEYARQNETYKDGEEYFTRVKSGGVDMHCTNLTEGTNEELETESDKIAEHVGLTPSQFKSLSFGIACMHIVNKVKHSDGEPAIVDMGSSYVMLEWCGCRGCFSGTYADWIDTCHGQVWLTSCQLFWNEDKRDGLASRVVRLWATILGLPDGFNSQIANEFGRKGRTKEQIELLRQLRDKLLGKARAVRAKNIEMLDRAGAELVSAFTTESTQPMVLSRALNNVAEVIKVGSSGAKRTKKTQTNVLSQLASKLKLHLCGDVVDHLSNELGITHLMSLSTTRSLMKTLSSKIFGIETGLNCSSSKEDIKDVLEKLKSSPVLEKLAASPDSNNEASVVFNKLKVHKQSILSQLPALSTNLLSIHRARVKTANRKAEREAEKAQVKEAKNRDVEEKAQAEAANRQVLLSAQRTMAFLRNQRYTKRDVVAVPGPLGIDIDNVSGSRLLYVSSVGDGSQLNDKVSRGDIIFCLDGRYVFNTSHQDVAEILQSKKENAARILEVCRKVS